MLCSRMLRPTPQPTAVCSAHALLPAPQPTAPLSTQPPLHSIPSVEPCWAHGTNPASHRRTLAIPLPRLSQQQARCPGSKVHHEVNIHHQVQGLGLSTASTGSRVRGPSRGPGSRVQGSQQQARCPTRQRGILHTRRSNSIDPGTRGQGPWSMVQGPLKSIELSEEIARRLTHTQPPPPKKTKRGPEHRARSDRNHTRVQGPG